MPVGKFQEHISAHLKLGLKFALCAYLKVMAVYSFHGAFSHVSFGSMDGRAGYGYFSEAVIRNK